MKLKFVCPVIVLGLAGAAGAGAEQAASAPSAAQKAQATELNEVLAPITAARRAKDWPKALALVDAAIARYPGYSNQLQLQRYRALLHVREDEAFTALQTEMKSGQHAHIMASVIAEEDGLSRRTYELAARAAEGQTGPGALALQASFAYHLGQPARAVELQKQFLEAAKGKAPAYVREEASARLKTYETAATRGAPQAPAQTRH